MLMHAERLSCDFIGYGTRIVTGEVRWGRVITIVWKKFTVGYFRVKIVHGKIFSSLEVSK